MTDSISLEQVISENFTRQDDVFEAIELFTNEEATEVELYEVLVSNCLCDETVDSVFNIVRGSV